MGEGDDQSRQQRHAAEAARAETHATEIFFADGTCDGTEGSSRCQCRGPASGHR
jgi:hypothetical protein